MDSTTFPEDTIDVLIGVWCKLFKVSPTQLHQMSESEIPSKIISAKKFLESNSQSKLSKEHLEFLLESKNILTAFRDNHKISNVKSKLRKIIRQKGGSDVLCKLAEAAKEVAKIFDDCEGVINPRTMTINIEGEADSGKFEINASSDPECGDKYSRSVEKAGGGCDILEKSKASAQCPNNVQNGPDSCLPQPRTPQPQKTMGRLKWPITLNFSLNAQLLKPRDGSFDGGDSSSKTQFGGAFQTGAGVGDTPCTPGPSGTFDPGPSGTSYVPPCPSGAFDAGPSGTYVQPCPSEGKDEFLTNSAIKGMWHDTFNFNVSRMSNYDSDYDLNNTNRTLEESCSLLGEPFHPHPRLVSTPVKRGGKMPKNYNRFDLSFYRDMNKADDSEESIKLFPHNPNAYRNWRANDPDRNTFGDETYETSCEADQSSSFYSNPYTENQCEPDESSLESRGISYVKECWHDTEDFEATYGSDYDTDYELNNTNRTLEEPCSLLGEPFHPHPRLVSTPNLRRGKRPYNYNKIDDSFHDDIEKYHESEASIQLFPQNANAYRNWRGNEPCDQTNANATYDAGPCQNVGGTFNRTRSPGPAANATYDAGPCPNVGGTFNRSPGPAANAGPGPCAGAQNIRGNSNVARSQGPCPGTSGTYDESFYSDESKSFAGFPNTYFDFSLRSDYDTDYEVNESFRCEQMAQGASDIFDPHPRLVSTPVQKIDGLNPYNYNRPDLDFYKDMDIPEESEASIKLFPQNVNAYRNLRGTEYSGMAEMFDTNPRPCNQTFNANATFDAGPCQNLGATFNKTRSPGPCNQTFNANATYDAGPCQNVGATFNKTRSPCPAANATYDAGPCQNVGGTFNKTRSPGPAANATFDAGPCQNVGGTFNKTKSPCREPAIKIEPPCAEPNATFEAPREHCLQGPQFNISPCPGGNFDKIQALTPCPPPVFDKTKSPAPCPETPNRTKSPPSCPPARVDRTRDSIPYLGSFGAIQPSMSYENYDYCNDESSYEKTSNTNYELGDYFRRCQIEEGVSEVFEPHPRLVSTPVTMDGYNPVNYNRPLYDYSADLERPNRSEESVNLFPQNVNAYADLNRGGSPGSQSDGSCASGDYSEGEAGEGEVWQDDWTMRSAYMSHFELNKTNRQEHENFNKPGSFFDPHPRLVSTPIPRRYGKEWYNPYNYNRPDLSFWSDVEKPEESECSINLFPQNVNAYPRRSLGAAEIKAELPCPEAPRDHCMPAPSNMTRSPCPGGNFDKVQALTPCPPPVFDKTKSPAPCPVTPNRTRSPPSCPPARVDKSRDSIPYLGSFGGIQPSMSYENYDYCNDESSYEKTSNTNYELGDYFRRCQIEEGESEVFEPHPRLVSTPVTMDGYNPVNYNRPLYDYSADLERPNRSEESINLFPQNVNAYADLNRSGGSPGSQSDGSCASGDYSEGEAGEGEEWQEDWTMRSAFLSHFELNKTNRQEHENFNKPGSFFDPHPRLVSTPIPRCYGGEWYNPYNYNRPDLSFWDDVEKPEESECSINLFPQNVNAYQCGDRGRP